MGGAPAGLGCACFCLGAVEHSRQRLGQRWRVVRGNKLEMPARNLVKGDPAARQVSPIPPPPGIGVVTDKDIRRARIRAEPVGRRDRAIVIAETGHLRRLAVFLGRSRHGRRLGAVPIQIISERSPASPEVTQPHAPRQFPPMPQMKPAAVAEIGDLGQAIENPWCRASWPTVEQREQRDSPSKALKLLGHFKSNHPPPSSILPDRMVLRAGTRRSPLHSGPPSLRP